MVFAATARFCSLRRAAERKKIAGFLDSNMWLLDVSACFCSFVVWTECQSYRSSCRSKARLISCQDRLQQNWQVWLATLNKKQKIELRLYPKKPGVFCSRNRWKCCCLPNSTLFMWTASCTRQLLLLQRLKRAYENNLAMIVQRWF